MIIETRDEYMQVTPEGFISRKGVLPTGSWCLLGAVRLNNFGKRVAFQPFPHCVEISNWQHKNGKQR